ncbi:hypothetical protein COX84_01935 [Candidatus Micrarchaeota archaeon CG_4_10_14_0_2_um_filter_49_7]|nr:MAG: hypothetical protein COX84_01935 [Candidatus Micrarchaeota archaeon CG_4_10_14_0_2_um_filter_49_7]
MLSAHAGASAPAHKIYLPPGARVVAKFGGSVISTNDPAVRIGTLFQGTICPMVDHGNRDSRFKCVAVYSAPGGFGGAEDKLTNRLIAARDQWQAYNLSGVSEYADMAMQLNRLASEHDIILDSAVVGAGEMMAAIYAGCMLSDMAGNSCVVMPPIKREPADSRKAYAAIVDFVVRNFMQGEEIDLDALKKFILESKGFICDKPHWPLEVSGGFLKDMDDRFSAFLKLMKSNQFIVVPGFIGMDREHVVRVSDRGGSDLTAIRLGMGVGFVLLVKDVGGVFTGPPKRYPNALVLHVIDFATAVVANLNGAQVIARPAIPALGQFLEKRKTLYVTDWPADLSTGLAGTKVVYGNWESIGKQVASVEVDVFKFRAAVGSEKLLPILAAALHAGGKQPIICLSNLNLGADTTRVDAPRRSIREINSRLRPLYDELEDVNCDVVPGLRALKIPFGANGFNASLLRSALDEAEESGCRIRRLFIVESEAVVLAEKQYERELLKILKGICERSGTMNALVQQEPPTRYNGPSIFGGLDSGPVGTEEPIDAHDSRPLKIEKPKSVTGYVFFGPALEPTPGVAVKIIGRLTENGTPLALNLGGKMIELVCVEEKYPDAGGVLVDIANEYLKQDGIDFGMAVLDGRMIFSAKGNFEGRMIGIALKLAQISDECHIPTDALLASSEEFTVVVSKEHEASMCAAFGIET